MLLPGLDGSDVFFRPLLACMPPGITVTTIEFPDGGSYSYPELLARVQTQIAGLPAFHVLAASFSGPLAVMLAAAMPEQVRSLTLVATFLRSPRPELRPLRLFVRSPLVWSLRLLRRLPVWSRAKDDPVRVAKRETWARVSARSLAARGRAVLSVDVRELLRRCELPVLCVTYEADTVVKRAWSEEIVGCCKTTRHVTLPGGHLGMFDDPRALADEILRFVSRDR